MQYQLDVTYMKCSFCTSKVNCHTCEQEIRISLQPLQLEAFQIDMLAKKMHFASDMDEDELLDALEAAGIFV